MPCGRTTTRNRWSATASIFANSPRQLLLWYHKGWRRHRIFKDQLSPGEMKVGGIGWWQRKICMQRDCVCAKASRSKQWGCKGCKGSCEGEASHRFLFCSNIIAPSRARLVSESSHHHHPSPWLILPDTFARVLPMRVIQTSLSLVG